MTPAAILSDPHFPDLKRYVLSTTGLSYYSDKNEDLAARLARRMGALKAPDCLRYLKLLEGGLGGAHEMESLVGELTIGETYFFRQVEHFDLLRTTVIPALIERNAESRSIRIWSAGCATGEEPYSIGILLDREFGSRLANWEVSILASDINNEFLTRAKAASYGEWAFRTTPHDIREQCFERRGATWILRPKYRKLVTFQRVNLAADRAMASLATTFDLIFCRNVMIYFANDLIGRTVTGFWDSLVPGGWLVVGHAEFNSTFFTRFTRVSMADASIYRKPILGPPEREREQDTWTFFPDPENHHEPPPHRARKPTRTVPVPPPSSATVTLEQVRDLADRGSWQAAAALCKQLISCEPLNAAAHFTLGLILESMASPGDAEPVLRKAIYLDRNFALAHYHLASCLQSSGKSAPARKSFHNVIHLLSLRPPAERVEHGDGITVDDLKEMAKLHLEILEAREKSDVTSIGRLPARPSSEFGSRWSGTRFPPKFAAISFANVRMHWHDLAAPADLEQFQQIMVFWVDRDRFAVPLSEVVEVIAGADITPVPGAPARVAGVMQVRGEIRPVYQLKELLGTITAESPDTVVLVRHRNREIGLRVGRVEDIRTLSHGEFQDAPPGNPRIKQLTADMVPVLDLAVLFDEPDEIANDQCDCVTQPWGGQSWPQPPFRRPFSEFS